MKSPLLFILLLTSGFLAHAQNWGKTPTIKTDGVMEIGRILDFHDSSDGTEDYSSRIWAEGNLLNTFSSFRLFGNSSNTTNLILAANYPNSFRWKFKTIDRGSGIDLDIVSTNTNDQEESMLSFSPSYTGRPELSVLTDAFVLHDGKVGIGTADPSSKLAIKTPSNGWIITSKAYSPDIGQLNGIKFLSGYPNDTGKWSGIASVSESEHSNLTGLALYAGQTERIRIASGGNVGIGTSDPQAKLAVNGNILAKEVKVKTDISVPDYVFEPDYQKPSLSEIEHYVKTYKHLPEVPSAKEINKEGLDLANMNMILLKKVEELTLLLIEERKERIKVETRLQNVEAHIYAN